MAAPSLHAALAERVRDWRAAGYPLAAWPAAGEMLRFAWEAPGRLRWLRPPQMQALETWWYLRLVLGTPRIVDLYRRLWPDPVDLVAALGLPEELLAEADGDVDRLLERLRTDEDLVRRRRLRAVRQPLALPYPSYVLALAMGAGKTALIGAIAATEMACALEHPEGPFVLNALVFAPGKTILGSLRQLAAMPWDRLLPPRHRRAFAAHLRLTFTRDGEADIPVLPGSRGNLVVTNTEKIRLVARRIKVGMLGARSGLGAGDDRARELVANRRLGTLAGLPRLAIFSDEAHHTYGRRLDRRLKRIRRTVDYLAARTELVAVANTTGTPYIGRRMLRDVVVRYGLARGIADGILKEVERIEAVDTASPEASLRFVVRDFLERYGPVRLPTGQPARLAVYLSRTAEVRRLKPVAEEELVRAGGDPGAVLINTSDRAVTGPAELAAFERLDHPRAPHRVILLVNKGMEGWDCPSLFACALLRPLTGARSAILQAATRALRQVPGNREGARLYLSAENLELLDRQLRSRLGETVEELGRARRSVRPSEPPPDRPPPAARRAPVRPERRRPERLCLARPTARAAGTVTSHALTAAGIAAGDERSLACERTLDAYRVAVGLSARYRLDAWTVYNAVRELYGPQGVPEVELPGLARQIEAACRAGREDR